MQWHLKGEPYAVQREALQRSAGREGYGYFMEMGLGKTAVVLNEYMELRAGGDATHLLVLCPFSVTGTWVDQINEWCPQFNDYVTVWPNKPTVYTRIFIVYYEGLMGRMYEAAEMWLGMHNVRSMLVLDESHKIKKYNGHHSKRAHNLKLLGRYRRVMTGTPMVQNVLDLWPQLRFISAIRGINPMQFRNKYAKMGGYMGKQIIGVNKDHEGELHEILNQHCFRAEKADWTDLPEKIYQTRQISLDAAQAKAYKKMADEFLVALNTGEEVVAEMVITQMLKLQQISRGFIIDENKDVHYISKQKHPAIETLLDAAESVTGKFIVFCIFRHSVEQVYTHLSAEGYCPAIIMRDARWDRDQERQRFNSDPKCRAVVVQTATGSLGLTLLGSGTGPERCSTTIFYENSFALGDRLQAEDRNHRHGQDRAVVYVDLVASSIDQRVIKALQQKRDLVAEIVGAVRSTRK